MIVKSVICVVCAVFFVVINVMVLFLKDNFNFALNDDNNYSVFYQKWIRTVVFMSTIILAITCIYFAIDLKLIISYSLLSLECLLVIIYALCRYKCITIIDDNITVERLFRKQLNSKISKITKVTYIPNAKLVVKIDKRKNFDVSFNSENFHKFYKTLLKNEIKFKTGRIPSDENHVYLTKYNITIHFPKTMFREYYQSKYFFRNSKYLFSARSLENHEYIEGYYKESTKEVGEFLDLVKNDLSLNEFKVISDKKENINGFDFHIIKTQNRIKKEFGRLAFVHPDRDNYLIIYADYMLEDELEFYSKMKDSIQRSAYEDGKSRIVRV